VGSAQWMMSNKEKFHVKVANHPVVAEAAAARDLQNADLLLWTLKNKEEFQVKAERLHMKRVLVMNGIVKKQEKRDVKVDKILVAVIAKKVFLIFSCPPGKRATCFKMFFNGAIIN
jgi:hypothetical protein